MDNIIIQYIRDEDYNPIGTVVAIDKGILGVSFCHSKDKFEKDRGKRIAIGRAKKLLQELNNDDIDYKATAKENSYFVSIPEEIPYRFLDDIDWIMENVNRRSLKYYK